MKRLVLVLAWSMVLLSAHAQATAIVAVLSGDSAPYKDALAGLKSVVGEVDSSILPALPGMEGAKVVVTFGGEAALKKYPGSVALVAALLSDPRLKPKHGGAVTRVGLLPDAAALVAKVRALYPGAATMAALDVGGAYSDYIAILKTAGAALGLAVSTRKIGSTTDLVGKLPGLKGTVKVLWLPPDPLIMNPQTFGLLATFCSAAKIALIAPVPALARVGAFAGIAPSFNAVGKAAGKAATAYADGKNPGGLVYPADIETVLNKVTAAAIGVDATAAASQADSVVP
jgi:ABC-type uncharacterized transport system substrate-binding protein